MLKSVVEAAMPMASVSTIRLATTGRPWNDRNARRTSCNMRGC
jgi:hypothetical protein